MPAPVKLIRLVSFVRGEMEDFPLYRELDARSYRSNRFKRRELERWVETMIIACVDMAKAVLVLEKRSLPDRYAGLNLALEGGGGFFFSCPGKGCPGG